MNTLDLQEAAKFLGLHPSTLQARAKAGAIPGAKIGKEWRFLDVDLAEYLRSQYPANKAAEAQAVSSRKSLLPIHTATKKPKVHKAAMELHELLNLPKQKRK